MMFEKRKVPPDVLRTNYEERWSAQDQAWATRREQCRCDHPRPGTRYFGESKCSRCQGFIPMSRP